jgi:hypothetical protein
MAGKPVQLDLSGEVEKAEQDARDCNQSAATWAARFRPGRLDRPWDTAGGTKKGDRVPGLALPRPTLQPDRAELHLAGQRPRLAPRMPGQEPFNGRCRRLRLLAAHRACEARQQGREPSDAPGRHQREEAAGSEP